MSHIGFVWALTVGLIRAPLMAISFLRRDYVVLKKTQKSKSLGIRLRQGIWTFWRAYRLFEDPSSQNKHQLPTVELS